MKNLKPVYTAKLKDEQMTIFIRAALETMDDLQVAQFQERWELICEDRGWRWGIEEDDGIDETTSKAVEKALQRATRQARI